MKKLTLFVFFLLITVAFARIIVMSGSSSGPTPFVDDANTIALYHFDEGSGTSAVDATGNYNASVFPCWTTGKFDDGLQCETTHTPSLTQGTLLDTLNIHGETDNCVTIEFWFKLDTIITPTHSGYGILIKENNVNQKLFVKFDSNLGTLDCICMNDAPGFAINVETTQTTWNADIWHYVAFVYDSTVGTNWGMAYLYIDGGLVDTQNNCYGMQPGTRDNFYGGYSSIGFPGVLDEMRISNIARTQAEIEAHWNKNK